MRRLRRAGPGAERQRAAPKTIRSPAINGRGLHAARRIRRTMGRAGGARPPWDSERRRAFRPLRGTIGQCRRSRPTTAGRERSPTRTSWPKLWSSTWPRPVGYRRSTISRAGRPRRGYSDRVTRSQRPTGGRTDRHLKKGGEMARKAEALLARIPAGYRSPSHAGSAARNASAPEGAAFAVGRRQLVENRKRKCSNGNVPRPRCRLTIGQATADPDPVAAE